MKLIIKFMPIIAAVKEKQVPESLFGMGDTSLETTILFGVTAGLLSLIGIVAIYMSMSTQQSIEKAREIIWELQSFLLDEPKSTKRSLDRLKWLKEHYKNLTETGSTSSFMILSVAVLTVNFVGISWLVYSFLIHGNWLFKIFIGVAALLLILFSFALAFLLDIKRIGNLPKYDEVFSVNPTKTNGIDMSELVLRHLICKVYYDTIGKKIKINLETLFPVDLNFFYPRTRALLNLTNTNDEIESYQSSFVNGTSNEIWFDLNTLSPQTDRKEMNFLLVLSDGLWEVQLGYKAIFENFFGHGGIFPQTTTLLPISLYEKGVVDAVFKNG